MFIHSIFPYTYVYLYPGPFTDMDPPQTVETVWVGLGKARGQYCATTLSQIATAGNWNEGIKYGFLGKVY